MESPGSEARRAMTRRGRARPSELIALVLALEERDQQEERDRRRLDREIGARYADATGAADAPNAGTAPSTKSPGLPLLRFWLQHAPSLELQARIRRVGSSLSLLHGLLLGVGLFMGWAAASALLQLEVHEGRINIVLCLGLLVLLPLGMLLLAVLGALWSLRPSNGGAGLSGGWRRFALARASMGLLPGSVRRDVEILLGRMTAYSRLYARTQRAQLFVWSQSVGLAFAAGALSATLAFVVFTDLAFGWSTTLDVEAVQVHRLTSLLSAPWAAFWPDAVPSLDLVESTRHFRVSAALATGAAAGPADPHIHFVDPILYGGWWPFLVASLLFYGLLPRLLVLGLGWRWLGREVGEAIALTPGVDRLLERLTTPIIETQATAPESGLGRAAAGMVPTVVATDWFRQHGGGAPTVVRWAEASSDEALVAALGTPALRVRDAGGRRTLAEDAALVAECGTDRAGAGQGGGEGERGPVGGGGRAGLGDVGGFGGVALCVRAYEPPVLEVLDFLADLRRAIGREPGLCVLLLEGTPADHEAWRHKLIELGDPRLCVAPLPPAGGEPASGATAAPTPTPALSTEPALSSEPAVSREQVDDVEQADG